MPSSYDKVYSEIKRLFDEYEDQRDLTVALMAYIEDTLGDTFRGNNIEIWLEPEIEPTTKRDPNQKYKAPDILLAIDRQEWLILDYKEITSTNEGTLLSHWDEVTEYDQEFNIVLDKKTMLYFTFTPKVGVICPQKIASLFSTISVDWL